MRGGALKTNLMVSFDPDFFRLFYAVVVFVVAVASGFAGVVVVVVLLFL